MPESAAPRKPRRQPPRRFWLFAPYVALVVAVAAWSVVWLAERAAITRTLDQTAENLRSAGWTVDWSDRSIDGYPFRLDVRLRRPKIMEPSGWGVSAPSIKVQAYAYNPDIWLAVAAEGATLARPVGGPVDVAARVLRASAGGFGHSPARLALEGVDVRFIPRPGAAAFTLTAVQRLGLFVRPSGADGAEGYLRLAGATAPTSQGWLGHVTDGRTFGAIADVLIARADAFKGRDWPRIAQHWVRAGGLVQILRAGLAAGPLHLGVARGEISADNDGVLKGGLLLDLIHPAGFLGRNAAVDPLVIAQAASVIEARAGDAGPRLIDLTFQAGAATLGPVAVGPAPRLY